MERCSWSLASERMIQYHDHEWGVPNHDPNVIFEFFSLDIFQAGLSWSTILNKRANFRRAFHQFYIDNVAAISEKDIEILLQDKSIVRNRKKIEAVIHNANIIRGMKSAEPFENYIWKFTHYKTLVNRPQNMAEIPARSKESDAMSRQMKKDGFKFVGSTICYAFMQSIGMVEDHTTTCFRKKELEKYVSK